MKVHFWGKFKTALDDNFLWTKTAPKYKLGRSAKTNTPLHQLTLTCYVKTFITEYEICILTQKWEFNVFNLELLIPLSKSDTKRVLCLHRVSQFFFLYKYCFMFLLKISFCMIIDMPLLQILRGGKMDNF